MIKVSAAIIEKDGKVLICKRAEGKFNAPLWEFPGGKREAGETAAECIVRECAEELGIAILVETLFAEFDWQADLHFSFFLASIDKGIPQALEHEEVRWVAKQELDTYVFWPADASIIHRIVALP